MANRGVASAARALSAAGPSEVVLKMGSHGAHAVCSPGKAVHAPALEVAVADVIGAGDSLVAGYLAAGVYGLDVPARLRWATVCAACTVGTHGDWEGLPTLTEIEERAGVGVTQR